MHLIENSLCTHNLSPLHACRGYQHRDRLIYQRFHPHFNAIDLIARLTDYQVHLEQCTAHLQEMTVIKPETKPALTATKISPLFNETLSVKTALKEIDKVDQPYMWRDSLYSWRIACELSFLDKELEPENQKQLFSKFLPFHSHLEYSPYLLFWCMEITFPATPESSDVCPVPEATWNFILSESKLLVQKFIGNVSYLDDEIYFPSLNFTAWLILLKYCTDESIFNQDIIDSIKIFSTNKSPITLHELNLMEKWFLKGINYEVHSLTKSIE